MTPTIQYNTHSQISLLQFHVPAAPTLLFTSSPSDGLDVSLERPVEVVVESQHPQILPGVWQVVVAVVEILSDEAEFAVLVTVAIGGGGEVIVVVSVSVVRPSLQPNQPGVAQAVVVEVDVIVVVGVVLSSRHPHQPGVLHVCVRVCVLELDVDVDVADDIVLVSVPLLSKNFQR